MFVHVTAPPTRMHTNMQVRPLTHSSAVKATEKHIWLFMYGVNVRCFLSVQLQVDVVGALCVSQPLVVCVDVGHVRFVSVCVQFCMSSSLAAKAALIGTPIIQVSILCTHAACVRLHQERT